MAKFCPNCGAEIGEAKFCPNCGKGLEAISAHDTPQKESKYVRKDGDGSQAGSVKKRHGCLIPILVIFGLFAVLAASFSYSLRGSDATKRRPIMDATQIAGATLEDLQAIYGNLEEDGPVNIVTKIGTTVEGTMYTLPNSMTNFILVDGATINFQFWSENPISYQHQSDILTMFGIEPNKDATVVVNTGSALRLSNVSEQVAEVWVQSMDSKNRTFDIVRVTFDDFYTG